MVNFTIDKPLAGHDEDAPAYADNQMLIVCDGLGGGGQNTYIIGDVKRTSAYLGSRIISNYFQKYISQYYEELIANIQKPGEIIDGLKTYLTQALNKYVADNKLHNVVRGKSMQMLPSTLAAVVFKAYDDHTDALVISAGDSRAYILTPESGLQQISKDDVMENVDAFEKTATMTNNIRQDGEFHINYGYFRLPAECILLVCSDGCFDYLSTPMELEFRLEYAITKCTELLRPGGNNFGEVFGQILENSGLKDDCTMAGAIIGYQDEDDLKMRFKRRGNEIQEKYRRPYAEFEKEALKRKTEAAAKMSELDRKVAQLSNAVDSKLREAVLLAFDCEIGCNGYAEHKNLQAALSSFEPYQRFLKEMKRAEDDIQKKRSAKEAEYSEEGNRLREQFRKITFESYRTRVRNKNFMSRWNEPPEFPKAADRCAEYQAILKKATKECNEALEIFLKSLQEIRMQGSETIQSKDRLLRMDEQYNQLRKKIDEMLNCRLEYDRKLEECFLEDTELFEKSFAQAWRQGFSSYARYQALQDSYRKCQELQREIDQYTPLTMTQKREKFVSFVDSHRSEFVSFVRQSEERCRELCGTLYDELSDLEKQREEIRKWGSAFDEKQRDLWRAYKPGYELYVHCAGGAV